MTQKTKKQHYVPQLYLNAWCIPGTHHVHIYDKVADSYRTNNIADVASERYFYDINPEVLFSDRFRESLRQNGLTLGTDSQVVENAFATEIEAPFSGLVKAILDSTSRLTPWYFKNCFFIKEDKKVEMSAYLAYQYVRSKHVRNSIQETANHITQFLSDLGVPKSEVSDYELSKDQAKSAHIRMLFDVETISEITQCFYHLTWMLAINRTDSKLFTSDSPIGTIGHLKDPAFPMLSMNGLASEGVEVFFPLSPDVLLIMVDGSYHKQFVPYDRRYIELTERESIDYYNSFLAMQAERVIISADSDMDLIERMKNQNRDALNSPHVQAF